MSMTAWDSPEKKANQNLELVEVEIGSIYYSIGLRKALGLVS